MLNDDFLVFDDVNSKLYNVGIFGDKLADSPERDVTFVSVPGRNGDVLIDNKRFKNITVPYKCYIIKDYEKSIRAFRDALLSKVGQYYRLEDSINDGEFRMAQISPISINEIGKLRAGEFTLKFNCKPQRFLKTGEELIEVEESQEILNPYNQTALPLIRAYGTGYFYIGSYGIRINSANEYTDIDCELMEAYKDTLATNCNANIEILNNAFPELTPGINEITLSGITKLEITPRWWIV